MGITGATKNLFGLVVGMQKAQFHLRMQARREFAGMTVDLANAVKPVLAIVDGIEGMEGNGPRNGKPVHTGLLLAGANCFAVDVVMAEVMGFKPAMSPITALALERGLTPDIAGIELAGTAKDERRRFAEPRTLRALEDRVPKWVAKLDRHQLTARPEITGKCIACGRCAAHCPPKAVTIANGKAYINYDMCIRCYCCQELCPADAVVLEEGTLLKLARRFV
jgi:ferredoxin